MSSLPSCLALKPRQTASTQSQTSVALGPTDFRVRETRALRLAPSLGPDLHVKLGNLRFRRQDVRDAAAHWERALQLDASNAAARANLDALAEAR